MRYVPRAAWGAKPATARTALRQSLGLAAHYNGPPLIIAGHDKCPEVVRSTQRFHMGPNRRWADVAYNWLICPHGVIYEGRGWGVRSAASGTNAGNANWHAVMVLIGQGQIMPDAAKVAFHELRIEHTRRYGTNGLRDHSTFKSTACAGNSVRDWVLSGAQVPGIDLGSDSNLTFEGDEYTTQYGQTDSEAVKEWQHFVNRFIYETGGLLAGGGKPHDRGGSHLKVDGNYGDKTVEFTAHAIERAEKWYLKHPLYTNPRRVTPLTAAFLVNVLRDVMSKSDA